jgi:hypothetical protein
MSRLLRRRFYVGNMKGVGRIYQQTWCYGKTPMRTFLDTIALAKEKLLPAS